MIKPAALLAAAAALWRVGAQGANDVDVCPVRDSTLVGLSGTYSGVFPVAQNWSFADDECTVNAFPKPYFVLSLPPDATLGGWFTLHTVRLQRKDLPIWPLLGVPVRFCSLAHCDYRLMLANLVISTRGWCASTLATRMKPATGSSSGPSLVSSLNSFIPSSASSSASAFLACYRPCLRCSVYLR